MTAAAPRPVLVTDDPDLLDEVLRLAVAAGVDLEVATGTDAVRAAWRRAPLVLIGADVAHDRVAGQELRRGVAVICRGSPPESVWERAVGWRAERVVALPDGEATLVGMLAEAGDPGGDPATVVAVTGGNGGAGASVLAAGLAVTAARQGRPVLLVDLDPTGGGLDLVLGAEETPGLRWDDLADTSGRISAPALREALPNVHGVAVLSAGRGPDTLPPDAVRSVVAAGRRMGGLVVLDLPRHPTPAAGAALPFAGTAFAVVSPWVRAVAAAAGALAPVRAQVEDVRLVVRRPPSTCVATGEISRVLAAPVAATWRTESGLSTALERGGPPGGTGRGPFAQLCRTLLGQVARPAEPLGRWAA